MHGIPQGGTMGEAPNTRECGFLFQYCDHQGERRYKGALVVPVNPIDLCEFGTVRDIRCAAHVGIGMLGLLESWSLGIF